MQDWRSITPQERCNVAKGNKAQRVTLRRALDEHHEEVQQALLHQKRLQAEAARKEQDIDEAWEYWRNPYDDDYYPGYARDLPPVPMTDEEWAKRYLDKQDALGRLGQRNERREELRRTRPLVPTEAVAVMRALMALHSRNDGVDYYSVKAAGQQMLDDILVSMGYEDVIDIIETVRDRTRGPF